MSPGESTGVLTTLLRELVFGAADPAVRTYVLNRGDPGLLASLDRLTAGEASAAGGGASIAAHVDHLRYGLSLLNRAAAGEPAAGDEVDWTASWRTGAVSDGEWQTLRDGLRREVTAWAEAMRAPRPLSADEATHVAASVPHIAYHLGAIRQIARGARGPTAEDEARAEAALRRP